MRNVKLIGGILIITGTCIGGGLLALPVASTPAGFLSSALAALTIWLIMLLGSLLILEMTQWFPHGSNVITISKSVLGKKGETVAWIIYLLLCYSLVCAYMSGGGDIFQYLLNLIHIKTTEHIGTLIFALALGYIVYKGTASIDIINRFFMILKFLVLFLLIGVIAPHVEISHLMAGKEKYIVFTMSAFMTSFGFSIVIPSLFDYFQGNVKKTRLIIIIGSIIPLVCYILWMLVIMGSLPKSGNESLTNILISGKTTSGLITCINHNLHIHSITDLSELFVAVCMFTSFLGVSLALTDLLTDGFQINNGKTSRFKICNIAFIPPLLIVYFWPKIFIIALSYAGLFVIIQQLILPAIIVWQGRYKKKISKNYQVFGGKVLLYAMFFAGFTLFAICTLGCFNFIKITNIS
jgi:tyrosine-specific transport protein